LRIVRQLPLSFAQQRLWLLEKLEPGEATYNQRSAYQIEGDLDEAALSECLLQLVRRHEALRTIFRQHDEQPVQVILDHLPPTFRSIDLAESEGSATDPLQRTLTREIRELFDLEKGSLVRVVAVHTAPQQTVLLVVMHHIISDGWSMGVLLRELLELYEAQTAGRPVQLAELPLQYADYSEQQRERLQGTCLERLMQYWRNTLKSTPPALQLPTDRPRPPRQTFQGAVTTDSLPAQQWERLQALARREAVTPFMLLLAVFKVLLQRWTQQSDLLVGTPIANRNRAEVEGLIGFFVNMLVLRTNLSGNPTFRELLQRVRATALDAFDHQDLPFEKLVEELQPMRDWSRPPLFQVMFVFQNSPMPSLHRGGLKLRSIEVEGETSRYDLSLFTWQDPDGGLALRFEYNTDLFAADTFLRMFEHLRNLCAGILESIDSPIGHLPLLTPQQQEVLLQDAAREKQPRPITSLVELFGRQLQRTPQAVALIEGERSWTFAELNEHSDGLAQKLRHRGVQPSQRVALLCERSLQAVSAMLAVFKVGAAVVPLDPAEPLPRLQQMLEDSRPALLLGNGIQHPGDQLPLPLLQIERDCSLPPAGKVPQSSSDPDGDAFVIFTSGSTGRPKGVRLAHAGLINRLQWMWTHYPYQQGEVCCQKTSLSFVDAIAEVFSPLLQGVPGVILPDSVVKNPDSLVEELARHRVSRIVLVPSLLSAVLQVEESLHSRLPALKVLHSSGEALSVSLAYQVQERLPGRTLLNLYGSSEVSADATVFELPAPADLSFVPLGSPIHNLEIYLLDELLRPVPDGLPGELCVGGIGLARGYLGNLSQTEEKFIPHPYSRTPGERLFRTGDRARRHAGGALEYLGRIDQQVKIRGQRIELAEIEAVLRNHRAVEDCVVLAEQRAGERELWGYVGSGEKPLPTAAELRTFLEARLPRALVPARLLALHALPRNSHGKLDRTALPQAPARELGQPNDRPTTKMEQTLAQIWCDALGVSEVRQQDHFYDLGGHSLQAVQVVRKLRKQLGLKILPHALLMQTLGQLAADCEQQGSSKSARSRFQWGRQLWRAARQWTGRQEGHAERS
jgi:amino acid adenylation domain-containing protein